jgi:CBS domain-containing protein
MARVRDLMQRDVRTILEDAPVSEAIQLLADGHVSALPVLNGTHELVGLVSTTDILSAEAETEDAKALNQVTRHTRVGEIMTPVPKTIDPEADVRLAAQEMLYLDIRRLLVVEDGGLAGVISQSDIVRAVANGQL